jgi:Uma2 family endonuclease
MDFPEGWRPEITERGIVMTPPPNVEHNLITGLLHDCLRQQLDQDFAIAPMLGVRVDPAERMYIPDLAVVAAADLRGEGSHVMADQLLLAVEITSPRTAADDRTSKVSGYAAGGVPLYLLIDRHAPEGPAVTLFSRPAGSTYRDSHQVPFGEPIRLPAPFDHDLPTDSFPMPEKPLK